MPRLPGPPLQTPRVRLRVPTAQDVDDIYRWARRPEVYRYLSWDPPERRADTAAFVREARRYQRLGWELVYVVRARNDGAFVGCVGAHYIDIEKDQQGELGVWIAPPFQGNGLATEIARTLLPHLFVNVGLHRLYAQVFPENARTIGLVKQLGFQFEGTLRQAVHTRGRRHDVHQYSLLKTDPAARRMIQAFRRHAR